MKASGRLYNPDRNVTAVHYMRAIQVLKDHGLTEEEIADNVDVFRHWPLRTARKLRAELAVVQAELDSLRRKGKTDAE